MSSEDKIRAKAKKIGEKYVKKLREIPGNLDSEQLSSEYGRIATEAEDELSKFLKSKGVDGHQYTWIGEDILTGMVLKEYRRILEERKAESR